MMRDWSILHNQTKRELMSHRCVLLSLNSSHKLWICEGNFVPKSTMISPASDVEVDV